MKLVFGRFLNKEHRLARVFVFASVAAGVMICGLAGKVVQAAEITVETVTVEGDSNGMKILEADNGVLFTASNITPGDSAATQLIIKNSYSSQFDLWVTVQNLHTGGGLDLLSALQINADLVYPSGAVPGGYGGVLPSFKIAPMESVSTYEYFLGTIPAGSTITYKVTALLDGATTGNEYQGTNAIFKLIFNATAPTPTPSDTSTPTPTPTPTGTSSPTYTNTPTNTPSPTIPPTNTPSPTIPPMPSTAPPTQSSGPDVVIPGESVPGGQIDIIPTNGSQNSIQATETPSEEIPADKIPGGGAQMPQTGERPLWTNAFLGGILVLSGILLIIARKRDKGGEERHKA